MIFLNEFGNDAAGIILGTVIDNDQFPIGDRLGNNGGNCLPNKRCCIIRWHNDRHKRICVLIIHLQLSFSLRLFCALALEYNKHCNKEYLDVPPKAGMIGIEQFHFHSLLISTVTAGVCLPITGKAGGSA